MRYDLWVPAIEITAASPEVLGEYARISIAFEVRSVFDVLGAAPPFTLAERPIEAPYVKDYDVLDGGPAMWPGRFDLSGWRLFVARVNGRPVGGAAVAPGGDGSATLWDLRVDASARGRGIGTVLFDAAARWARDRGRRRIEVETQDVNVPACRFYARCGCVLAAVRRGAYLELPGEVQLVWSKELA